MPDNKIKSKSKTIRDNQTNNDKQINTIAKCARGGGDMVHGENAVARAAHAIKPNTECAFALMHAKV